MKSNLLKIEENITYIKYIIYNVRVSLRPY